MKVCDAFCYPFQLRGIPEINANFEAEWDGDIFEVEIEVNGLKFVPGEIQFWSAFLLPWVNHVEAKVNGVSLEKDLSPTSQISAKEL